MVLNCRLFSASHCDVGHDTRFEAAVGGNVVCHCINNSDVTAHPFSLVMPHYHCHSGLMYGSMDYDDLVVCVIFDLSTMAMW